MGKYQEPAADIVRNVGGQRKCGRACPLHHKTSLYAEG